MSMLENKSFGRNTEKAARRCVLRVLLLICLLVQRVALAALSSMHRVELDSSYVVSGYVQHALSPFQQPQGSLRIRAS